MPAPDREGEGEGEGLLYPSSPSPQLLALSLFLLGLCAFGTAFTCSLLLYLTLIGP